MTNRSETIKAAAHDLAVFSTDKDAATHESTGNIQRAMLRAIAVALRQCCWMSRDELLAAADEMEREAGELR